jgi:hypothetical protein
MSAGKGDKPRNCFTKKFKDNFDQIKWEKAEPKVKVEKKKGKTVYYFK